MASIDYVKKSKLLKTDICKRINYIDKQTYLNSKEGIVQDYDLDSKYFDLLNEYDYKDIEEARKINKASYNRVKRLRDKISVMLESPCVFLTLNFSDKVLKETTEQTRRKYVTLYLKQFGCMYVANKDFGSDKEYTDRKGRKRKGTKREHYHALLQIEFMKDKGWKKYGQQFREKVVVKDNTNVRLSRYISKLTNHAIKETTKRSAIIYSRDK